jgi:hypothetical protein
MNFSKGFKNLACIEYKQGFPRVWTLPTAKDAKGREEEEKGEILWDDLASLANIS